MFEVQIQGQYGEQDGSIHIVSETTGEEWVSWDSAEWIEDPSVVFVIVEASRCALEDPTEFMARCESVIHLG